MYVETIPGYYPDGSSWRYYNVSHPVGQGLVSFRDDVMLVQWFLNEIFYNHPSYQSQWLPDGDLEIDGKCGPITAEWILQFQVDSIGLAPLYPDGRVDKAPGGTTHSWRGSRYTIVWMNEKMRDIYPGLYGAGGMLTIPATCPGMLSAMIAQIGPLGP